MSAVAHFSEEVRILMEKQSSSEREQLERGLQQLAMDVAAFKRALKTRKKLQYAYTTKQNQIKQQQKQMNAGKKKDIDKISAELHDLEKASSVLKVKLEECSGRITKEATRVRPIIEWKLKNCLREYAAIQIECGEKVRDAWAKLMPKFNDGGDGVEIEVTGKLTTIQLLASNDGGNGVETEVTGNLTTLQLSDSAGEPIHPAPAAAPPALPSAQAEFPDVLLLDDADDAEDKPTAEEEEKI